MWGGRKSVAGGGGRGGKAVAAGKGKRGVQCSRGYVFFFFFYPKQDVGRTKTGSGGLGGGEKGG